MSLGIFKNGSRLIKLFRAGLSLNDEAYVEAGAIDPTSIAVDSPRGSLYLNTASGKLFRKNDNGSSTNWTELASTSGILSTVQGQRNALSNGDFSIWQRGTSFAAIASGSPTYTADRFYGSVTSTSKLTVTQEAGVVTGSKYGLKAVFSGPAGGGTFEIGQVLENSDSRRLLGKYVSCSAYLRAWGNVTQVGIQFMKAATETKPSTTIGAEQLCAVTSGFALFKLENVLLDHVAAGVVGIRFRPTAVSTGNIYDPGNGFGIEKVMMNEGAVVGEFRRSGSSAQDELAICQRYFEKSYDLETPPGSAVSTNYNVWMAPRSTGGAQDFCTTRFAVTKRAAPTMKLYSTDGTVNTIRNTSAASNVAAGYSSQGTVAFTIYTPLVDQNVYLWHWTADAEI